MAAVEEPVQARPNIRIEIHNNVTKMDVDEENEDGEILDDDDDDVQMYSAKLSLKNMNQVQKLFS